MGGSPQTIQQAPAQPAPDVGQTAGDIYEARLEYDPKIAAQQQGLAEQYYPQQVGLQASLLQQFAPQAAGLQQDIREQYSPTQAALTEAFAQQGLDKLQAPFAQPEISQRLGQEALAGLTDTGLTPEQEAAQSDIRGRETSRLQEAIRTRANLGGGLFGGRAAGREAQAVSELGQAFAAEDINRQLAQRQASMQTALGVGGFQEQLRAKQQQEALQFVIPSIQQLFPQTQFPGQPGVQAPVGQSAVPSPDALLAAMTQAGQQQAFQTERVPGGVNLGILGQWGAR